MIAKEKKRVETLLSSMSDADKLFFAIGCCERLLPGFHAFSEVTGWSGGQTLADSIEIGWKLLLDGTCTVDLDGSIKQVYGYAPDTEDFGTDLVSFALDAAVAVCALLEYIKNGDDSHLYEIAMSVYDSIDLFAELAEKDCRTETGELGGYSATELFDDEERAQGITLSSCLQAGRSLKEVNRTTLSEIWQDCLRKRKAILRQVVILDRASGI